LRQRAMIALLARRRSVPADCRRTHDRPGRHRAGRGAGSSS
jgi:hypothetical protein